MAETLEAETAEVCWGVGAATATATGGAGAAGMVGGGAVVTTTAAGVAAELAAAVAEAMAAADAAAAAAADAAAPTASRVFNASTSFNSPPSLPLAAAAAAAAPASKSSPRASSLTHSPFKAASREATLARALWASPEASRRGARVACASLDAPSRRSALTLPPAAAAAAWAFHFSAWDTA